MKLMTSKMMEEERKLRRMIKRITKKKEFAE
jgi:hypothetical protein